MRAVIVILAAVLAAMVASPAFAKTGTFAEVEDMDHSASLTESRFGHPAYSGQVATGFNEEADIAWQRMSVKGAQRALVRACVPPDATTTTTEPPTVYLSIDGELAGAQKLYQSSFCETYVFDLSGLGLKGKKTVALSASGFSEDYYYAYLDYVELGQ
jgi:hypothetical protein